MASRPSEPVHDWTGDGRHAMLVCGWTRRLLVDSAASKAALASREVNSGEKFTVPRIDTHFSGNPVNRGLAIIRGSRSVGSGGLNGQESLVLK